MNYGTAAMILAAASIQNPDYVPTSYQVSADGRVGNAVQRCADIAARPTS